MSQDTFPSVERPDPHPWRAAVVLGVVAIAVTMLGGFVLGAWFRHDHGWQIAGDVWVPLQAAEAIVDGHLTHLYASTPLFVAMPLLPILLVPVAEVARILHLTQSIPREIARPTVWLVYGPWGLASGIVFLAAFRALATQIGIRRGRAWLQTVATVVVLGPVAAGYGHYEDVLALTFLMLSLRAAFRERFLAAALLLGVAIGFKQWAVLALPLLVAIAPRSERRRTILAAAALPAALAALVLPFDWQHASRGLFEARSFPGAGHVALWISRSHAPLVSTPFRLGAVVAAIAVAVRIRDRADPPVVIGALAVIFFARLVFEPVLFSYYVGPPLSFALLHERLRAGRTLRTLVVGGALLLLFQWQPAPILWWPEAAALGVVLAAPSAREVRATRISSTRARPPALAPSSPPRQPGPRRTDPRGPSPSPLP